MNQLTVSRVKVDDIRIAFVHAKFIDCYFDSTWDGYQKNNRIAIGFLRINQPSVPLIALTFLRPLIQFSGTIMVWIFKCIYKSSLHTILCMLRCILKRYAYSAHIQQSIWQPCKTVLSQQWICTPSIGLVTCRRLIFIEITKANQMWKPYMHVHITHTHTLHIHYWFQYSHLLLGSDAYTICIPILYDPLNHNTWWI